MASKFDCKPTTVFRNGSHLSFNRVEMGLSEKMYSISQLDQAAELQKINKNNVDKTEYIAQRTRGVFLAAVGSPNLTFGFAYASQFVDPDHAALESMDTHIGRAKEKLEFRLRYIPIEKSFLGLGVFAFASFIRIADLTSQLGYVIVTADANGRTNILLYTGVKSKRVTKSVLGTALFSAIHAFDFARTLRTTLNDMFDRVTQPTIFTDYKSLFDSIVELFFTTKKAYFLVST